MPDLRRRLREDHAMRDAARRLLETDLDFIRRDVKREGVGARLADRAGDRARDFAGSAADYASAHRAKVGTGVLLALGVLVAWLFRARIGYALDGWLARLEGDQPEDDGREDETADEAEQDRVPARSGGT